MSLRRFFMDRRLPVDVREGLPLVAAGRQILWIPGQSLEGALGQARFIRLEMERG
jgi:hypothetical protein